MKTTSDRDVSKLDKNFKRKVDAFMAEVNANNKIIFITEWWRSQERQNELIKAGLSQVKRSNHQDWLAIDIGFYGSELYPSDNNRWRKVADIAKKYGIDWGYDLWKWDKPHFQDNGKILPLITIPMTSKYSDIMAQTLKDANFAPLFEKHEGDTPLTEQEVKELIEISFARFAKRNKLV